LFRSHRGPTSTTSTAMQPHRPDQPHARSSDGKHRCSATARECVCCQCLCCGTCSQEQVANGRLGPEADVFLRCQAASPISRPNRH
jgi:hypothetical protein